MRWYDSGTAKQHNYMDIIRNYVHIVIIFSVGHVWRLLGAQLKQSDIYNIRVYYIKLASSMYQILYALKLRVLQIHLQAKQSGTSCLWGASRFCFGAHEVLFVFVTPLCHLKETQYWLSYLCGRHTALYLV